MLNKQEIATIAYFNQFDFPLTKEEIKRWRFGFFNDDELQNNLVIKSKQGFYFVEGRDEIVEERKKRYIIADKKFERALKFVRLFRLLPSVRMIAICNSLAFSNARTESDIDFFIVSKSDTIWLTRFWLQAFLRLFRLRPHDHGISIEDALCLSFFTVEDNLDFENLQITKPDIYLALWLSQLVAVYDPNGIYNKIWQKNSWIKNILPEVMAYDVAPQRRVQPSVLSRLLMPLTWLFWEKLLASFQQKLLPNSLRNIANKDTRVILNNTMLKFHSNDRREEMYNKWRKRLRD